VLLTSTQWRRLREAWGDVPSTFTNGWARGHRCRRTANKKLTKLYWPSRKRSPKRLTVLLEPKSGGARPTTKIFRRFAPDRCPPLSNLFQCHCKYESHRPRISPSTNITVIDKCCIWSWNHMLLFKQNCTSTTHIWFTTEQVRLELRNLRTTAWWKSPAVNTALCGNVCVCVCVCACASSIYVDRSRAYADDAACCAACMACLLAICCCGMMMHH